MNIDPLGGGITHHSSLPDGGGVDSPGAAASVTSAALSFLGRCRLGRPLVLGIAHARLLSRRRRVPLPVRLIRPLCPLLSPLPSPVLPR